MEGTRNGYGRTVTRGPVAPAMSLELPVAECSEKRSELLVSCPHVFVFGH